MFADIVTLRKGVCAVCGKTKTQFLKIGSGLFNKAVSKLPFEMHLGTGVKKSPPDAIKWTDKLADELHKPVRKKFRKRKVVVTGIDKIWAADLVDMQAFLHLTQYICVK